MIQLWTLPSLCLQPPPLPSTVQLNDYPQCPHDDLDRFSTVECRQLREISLCANENTCLLIWNADKRKAQPPRSAAWDARNIPAVCKPQTVCWDFTSLVRATNPQRSSGLNVGMCFVNESQCCCNLGLRSVCVFLIHSAADCGGDSTLVTTKQSLASSHGFCCSSHPKWLTECVWSRSDVHSRRKTWINHQIKSSQIVTRAQFPSRWETVLLKEMGISCVSI